MLRQAQSEFETLFWQHPSGHHALRLNHQKGALVGVNLMGIRFRHEVCEQWIREERKIEWVIKNLKRAHFDPEFYRTYYKQIRQHFERVA